MNQLERKRVPSFCVVYGYNQQKEINVKILEYLLGSIRALLGNYCTAADLREVAEASSNEPGFFKKKYQ